MKTKTDFLSCVVIENPKNNVLLEGCRHDEKARKTLQQILDLKFKSKSPKEFADRMSAEIRQLITKYGRAK